jgi:hypothetical protein
MQMGKGVGGVQIVTGTVSELSRLSPGGADPVHDPHRMRIVSSAFGNRNGDNGHLHNSINLVATRKALIALHFPRKQTH